MRGDSDDEHGPTSAPPSRQMSRTGSAASPRRSRSVSCLQSCFTSKKHGKAAGVQPNSGQLEVHELNHVTSVTISASLRIRCPAKSGAALTLQVWDTLAICCSRALYGAASFPECATASA